MEEFFSRTIKIERPSWLGKKPIVPPQKFSRKVAGEWTKSTYGTENTLHSILTDHTFVEKMLAMRDHAFSVRESTLMVHKYTEGDRSLGSFHLDISPVVRQKIGSASMPDEVSSIPEDSMRSLFTVPVLAIHDHPFDNIAKWPFEAFSQPDMAMTGPVQLEGLVSVPSFYYHSHKDFALNNIFLLLLRPGQAEIRGDIRRFNREVLELFASRMPENASPDDKYYQILAGAYMDTAKKHGMLATLVNYSLKANDEIEVNMHESSLSEISKAFSFDIMGLMPDDMSRYEGIQMPERTLLEIERDDNINEMRAQGFNYVTLNIHARELGTTREHLKAVIENAKIEGFKVIKLKADTHEIQVFAKKGLDVKAALKEALGFKSDLLSLDDISITLGVKYKIVEAAVQLAEKEKKIAALPGDEGKRIYRDLDMPLIQQYINKVNSISAAEERLWDQLFGKKEEGKKSKKGK
jgi:hypothetical protein